MNFFEFSHTSRNFPHGTAKVESDYNVFTRKGALGDNVNFFSYELNNGIVDRVNNDALYASLSDLKGMRVNLGVMFGERKQTAELILGTAKRIADAIQDVKRGHGRAALGSLGYDPIGRSARMVMRNVKDRRVQKASKQFANDFLAIQYGLKPLLGDIYNLGVRLAEYTKKPWRTRVSVSRSYRWAVRNALPNEQWHNVKPLRIETGVYSRKYVYIFAYSPSLVHELSSLGITNPAAIAWELLPWSFVFDWLVNVGQWIDSLDATLGLQFEKGCVTEFRRVSVRYKTNATASHGPYVSTVNGRASYLDVYCKRLPLNGFVHAYAPNWKPHIGAERTANGVALLRQRLFK